MLFRETFISKLVKDAKYLNALCGKVQRSFYGPFQNIVKKQL
jgi:hypothetical protein